MPPPPINITADEEGCTNPPNNPSNSSVVLPAPSMQCRPNLTDATAHPRLAAHPPQQLRATPPETNAAAFSVLSSSQNNNNSINASSSAHPNSTVSTLHPSSAGLIENTGRWTAEEHRLFLRGLEQHGKGWKKIATLIQSRTVVQIRTHAQKYFQKLAKAHLQNGDSGMGLVRVNAVGGVGEAGIRMAMGGEGALCDPQGVGGGVVSVMGTAEIDGTSGILTGQPVAAMRTINVPPRSLHANNHLYSAATSVSATCGNIGVIGADPASSWATGGVGAALAFSRGGGKKQRASLKGGTKRRVIGNIIRSAVREGRNIKRQKTAEVMRNCGDTPAISDQGPSLLSDGALPSTAKNPTMTLLDENQVAVGVVPNPLPSVSQVLEPYVMVSHSHPPPAAPMLDRGIGGGSGFGVTSNGRGSKQIVHTATHGLLPMAALEDAVFRLLTPATGAPVLLGKKPPSQHYPNNNVHPHYPAHHPPGHTVQGSELLLSNPSPTGVADVSLLLPSWVDVNNPPSWYSKGADIDTLLDDADCLNWLSDTGDLDETYPPAVAEPAAVVPSSSTAADINGGATEDYGSYDVEPAMIIPDNNISVQDPTGGVFHPSTESLSFLVDPPDFSHRPKQSLAAMTHAEDVDHLPTFLEDEHLREAVSVLGAPLNTVPYPDATGRLYASATEAVEATSKTIENPDTLATSIIPEHKLVGEDESHNNLMGFPDLDMGDEQAFFTELLESSRQSPVGFAKLNSDVHIHGHPSQGSGMHLESVTGGDIEKMDDYTQI